MTTNLISTILQDDSGTLSAALDMFGTMQGAVLYRDAIAWKVLGPGTSGQALVSGGAGANPAWGVAGGTGTVSSVGASVPAFMSVSGSPVTTTGTLAFSFNSQSANLIFAGPTSGSAAPAFRSLVATDIPSISITGISGLAANMAAFLAGGTSAQLAAATTGTTGTGSLVFSISPILVTPAIGVATATTVNKVAITAPATAATLTLIDGTTSTGPAATGTLATLANAETFTNKRVNPRINTIASSATPTPAGDTTDEFTVTAQAVAATFAAPTGTPVDGQKLIIRIKDNATAQTLAWNAIYRAGTDVALSATTVISKTMYLGFLYNAADTKWDLVALVNNI